MRSFCVLTFFCYLIAVALCQTAGSDPCSATVVSVDGATGNVTMYGSTTGKGTFQESTCVPSPTSGVVWYTITPEAGKNVVVSTCGSYTNFDTFLGVYTGSCDQLSCFKSNNDGHCDGSGGSSFSSFFFSSYDESSGEFYPDPSTIQWVSDGSQYFIAVSGNEKEYGNFDFTVMIGEDLSGCPAAKEVQGPYTGAPIVVNATIRADETAGNSNCHNFHFDQPAVWFKIFPESNKQMNVTTCNAATNFDTRMAVLSGDCNDMSCDYENDDDNCHIVYETSTINFLPTESSYYVLVTSFHYEESLNFALMLSQNPNSQDPNCVAAIPLTVGVSGSPEASTATLGTQLQSSVCGDEQGLAVWFRVKSYNTGIVTFSTCNDYTNFDTVLSLYGGQCDGLTCIAQNDNGCTTGSGSTITAPIEAYVPYFLVVSGANGATGDFQISILA